jgi:hypothetical protein
MNEPRRREKKVPRNYRITSLADFIIKRAARELNTSEAELIEMCVLDRALELIARHNLLKRLTLKRDFPPDLTKIIRDAQLEMFNRWKSKLPRVRR